MRVIDMSVTPVFHHLGKTPPPFPSELTVDYWPQASVRAYDLIQKVQRQNLVPLTLVCGAGAYLSIIADMLGKNRHEREHHAFCFVGGAESREFMGVRLELDFTERNRHSIRVTTNERAIPFLLRYRDPSDESLGDK